MSTSSSVSSTTTHPLSPSSSSTHFSPPPPLDTTHSRVLTPLRRQLEARQSSVSPPSSPPKNWFSSSPPPPSRAPSEASSRPSSPLAGKKLSPQPASFHRDVKHSSPHSPDKVHSAAFSSSSVSAFSSDKRQPHPSSFASTPSSLIDNRSRSPLKGNQAPLSPKMTRIDEEEDDEVRRQEPVHDFKSELHLSSALAVPGSNQVKSQAANEDDYKGVSSGQTAAASRLSRIEDVEAEPEADSEEIKLSPRAVGSINNLDEALWTEGDLVLLRELLDNPDIKCSVPVICRLRDRGDLGPDGKVICFKEDALRDYYKKKIEILFHDTELKKNQKFVKDKLLEGCKNPRFKWGSELGAPQIENKLRDKLIVLSLINKETDQIINPKIVSSVLENATFQKKE